MKRNRLKFKKKLTSNSYKSRRMILQIWKRKRRIAERRGVAFMIMQSTE